MKTTLRTFLVIPVVLALLLTGCSLDDPDHPTSLQAPPLFSSYVALGNSLTAGYMDSGLMLRGQLSSYPAMIAGQLGITDFTMPRVDRPGIGSTNVGAGNIAGVLAFNAGTGEIAPLGITPAAAVQGLLLDVAQSTPYHNLGVPGITLADLFSGYSSLNSQSHSPFLDFVNRYSLYGNSERFADVVGLDQQPDRVSYQTCSTGWQAVAKGPTLATLWIGNNDVLTGATGGNPSTANLTDPTVFAGLFNQSLQILAGGLLQRTGFPATILVANIPNVTDVAYFISEETFNSVLEANSDGALTAWPGGYMEGADPELLTFPVLQWVGERTAEGVPQDSLFVPIPAKYTLTTAEKGLVDGYVAGYNQAINAVVTAVDASGYADVGLVDVNAVLAALPAVPSKTHFMLLLPQMGGDVAMAAAATEFSLDGVHPNNHGYVRVANAFIAKLNEMTGAEVAAVDPADHPWDPTYAPAGKAGPAVAAAPRLTPEAAAGMAAIWR